MSGGPGGRRVPRRPDPWGGPGADVAVHGRGRGGGGVSGRRSGRGWWSRDTDGADRAGVVAWAQLRNMRPAAP